MALPITSISLAAPVGGADLPRRWAIWQDAPVNRQRRVLVCVAVGAALALAATVINRLLASDPDGGWFMYSPSTEPVFSPAASDGEMIRAAVTWLTAIGLWFGFSWWLFRRRGD
jgi:hypothetical protein